MKTAKIALGICLLSSVSLPATAAEKFHERERDTKAVAYSIGVSESGTCPMGGKNASVKNFSSVSVAAVICESSRNPSTGLMQRNFVDLHLKSGESKSLGCAPSGSQYVAAWLDDDSDYFPDLIDPEQAAVVVRQSNAGGRGYVQNSHWNKSIKLTWLNSNRGKPDTWVLHPFEVAPLVDNSGHPISAAYVNPYNDVCVSPPDRMPRGIRETLTPHIAIRNREE